MSDFVFSSEGVERTGTFQVMPQGDYPIIISSTEWKSPKNDPAGPKYLQLNIEIVEGEYKGRKLTDRLNLNHASDMTRKIAKGTLATILDCIGLVSIQNTAEVCMKPMLAKVTVKPAQGQYGESNEVKGYKPIKQGVSAPAAPTAAPSTKKPWE